MLLTCFFRTTQTCYTVVRGSTALVSPVTTEPAFPARGRWGSTGSPAPPLHQNLGPIAAVYPARPELPVDPPVPGTSGPAATSLTAHSGADPKASGTHRQGVMKVPHYSGEEALQTYLIQVQLETQFSVWLV